MDFLPNITIWSCSALWNAPDRIDKHQNEDFYHTSEVKEGAHMHQLQLVAHSRSEINLRCLLIRIYIATCACVMWLHAIHSAFVSIYDYHYGHRATAVVRSITKLPRAHKLLLLMLTPASGFRCADSCVCYCFARIVVLQFPPLTDAFIIIIFSTSSVSGDLSHRNALQIYITALVQSMCGSW